MHQMRLTAKLRPDPLGSLQPPIPWCEILRTLMSNTDGGTAVVQKQHRTYVQGVLLVMRDVK